MTLPIYLKPNKEFELLRIGKDNDGGYLVGKNSLKDTRILFSCGIYDDWSFEKNFFNLNKNLKIFFFDNVLDYNFLTQRIIIEFIKIFIPSKRNKFLRSIINYFDYFFFIKNKLTKKKISHKDVVNMTKEFDNNIFFKIDIEGSEYRLLDDLVQIKHKLSGLVIEFHDIDLHIERIKKFIQNINLELIHIHPNNYSSLDKNNNPTAIELTFEKNPAIKSDKLTLPNFLDMKNDPLNKNISLNFNE